MPQEPQTVDTEVRSRRVGAGAQRQFSNFWGFRADRKSRSFGVWAAPAGQGHHTPEIGDFRSAPKPPKTAKTSPSNSKSTLPGACRALHDDVDPHRQD